MKEVEIRGALFRYRKAVAAYERLLRNLLVDIRELAPGPETRHRLARLQEALETLLPVLGECIAELPGLASALRQERETLDQLRRQAEEAGVILRYDEARERGPPDPPEEE